MNAYLRFVERHARLIVALTLAVTLGFASQLGRLNNDTNFYFLPESHPARQAMQALQQEFKGTLEAALIAVEKKDGVFNRETLDAVLELTQDLRRLSLGAEADARWLEDLSRRLEGQAAADSARELIQQILAGGLTPADAASAGRLREEVERAQLELDAADRHFIRCLPGRLAPIAEMAGLAATDNFLTRGEVLVAQRSLKDKTTPPEVVRREVMDNPMFRLGVVTDDATATLIAIELRLRPDDSEGLLRAQSRIRELVEVQRQRHPHFADHVHLAGLPIYMAEQSRLVDQDLGVLLPIVLLVIVGILVLYFRRPLGILLPILNVTFSAIWTLGLMALLRVPMDMVTSVLPIFLVTICGADALHLMTEFYTQRAQGLSRKAAILASLRLLTSPVVLTTVTTVIGFMFATATQIESIRNFGWFTAFGLVCAQLIAATFIPACICCLREGRPAPRAAQPQAEAPAANRLGRLICRAMRPVVAHRTAAATAFAVALLVAGWSASAIHIEDEGASYFRPGNPVRASDDFINGRMSGTSPVWVTIDTGRPGGAADLATLRFIDQLDQWLLAQAHVRFTYSLAKYVRRVQVVMNGNDASRDRLPRDTEQLPAGPDGLARTVPGSGLVDESLLMLENSAGTTLAQVLNADRSKAVTLFSMGTTKATEYRALLTQLDAWARANRPPGVEVRVAGSPVVWSALLEEILQGQLLSFFLAYGVVLLVLVLWLRSLRQGVVASLPLCATMVFYFGAMSALGIDLNIGTALISYLVVGIVDYAVHFMHRVVEHHQGGHTADEAVLHAAEHAGSSIFFNILLFSLGFLTLTASDFTSLRHLGLLVTLSLIISGLTSLFVIGLCAPWFLKNLPRAAAASAPRGAALNSSP